MKPDTIVLVHGFWVTPRSWEHWITHFEAKGYRVIAPGYPGFEVEVEALRAEPQIIADVTVPAIIEKLEEVIKELDRPPIIMGHSAGGAFTQILLDHGHGAAGVAFNSAPTEGVRVVPLSQVKSTFPVLKSPANRHKAIGLTAEQWRYAFTNTFTEEESAALYERYHVPASGAILWGGVLANYQPGPQETWVDYRNANRAPLLFVSGSEDHIMPPAIQRSNQKHYNPTRSPRSASTRATLTCCRPSEAGNRSLTMRWHGPSSTPVDHQEKRGCGGPRRAAGHAGSTPHPLIAHSTC